MILPETTKAAIDAKLEVGEYISSMGVVDSSVCWLMGYDCEFGLEGCDFKGDLGDMDEYMLGLIDKVKDDNKLVSFFLKNYGVVLKDLLAKIKTDDLYAILGGNYNRLSNMVLAEISLRRGEIKDWIFEPIRDGYMGLIMSPKNDEGEVVMEIQYSFPNQLITQG